MISVGQVEQRSLLDAKGGVGGTGLAAEVHDNALAVERPFRPRKLTRGHRAVVYDVNFGPRFLHYLSGKREGVRRGQDHVEHVEGHSAGPAYVVKLSGLRFHVIQTVRGDDVLVMWPAIERNVAAGGGFAG